MLSAVKGMQPAQPHSGAMVTFKVPIFGLLHVVVTLVFPDPRSPLPPPTGT